jgi:flagellar motor switch protein FliM
MSNILSQDEINALLSGVLDESAETEVPEEGGVAPAPKQESFITRSTQRVTKYDFRRPNVFPKEHMRTIQNYHENFARLFGASLAVFLRQDIKLYLTYIEQHIYSEFIDESDEKSIYHIVSFLNDQAIMSINIDIAFLLIEKLLGGEGEKTGIDRNEFTEIELMILKQLMERMCGALKTCWEPLMTETPKLIATEMNPKLIHLLPQNDPILKLVFELVIGEHIGIITFCLPYIALEPYMDQIVLHTPLLSRAEKGGKEKELKSLLNKVKVPLSAVLGTTDLSVDQVNNLEQGDVIKLGQKINVPLQLNVGHLNKFTGEIGTFEKHLAIKINDVLHEESQTLEEKLLGVSKDAA